MKDRKYIKNGFLDVKHCKMYKEEDQTCTGLKLLYCMVSNYDCPFFKDTRIKNKKEKRRKLKIQELQRAIVAMDETKAGYEQRLEKLRKEEDLVC